MGEQGRGAGGLMAVRGERIVVLGVMSKTPVGGVVWQTLHYLLGLERLGFDVHYVEAHATPPKMFMDVDDKTDRSDRAAAFIARTLDAFGFRGRWAYHALHYDGRCHGMTERELRELCRSADILINLHGSTVLRDEHFAAETIVYLETDPTEMQIELAEAQADTLGFLGVHDAFFTFGENYGNADCGLPVSDRFLFRPTRQPVLIDMWTEEGPLPAAPYTTVGNWRQPWRQGVKWEGDHYSWSKHHEFAKILDVPARAGARFELALACVDDRDRALLAEHGWGLRDALEVSLDHRDYRAFIGASRGEFTVAKDQNIRLRSGWFSDRSATYLAAGRPVITQDTAFGNVLPTGEGLFAFLTADDVLAAIEAIESDPERHARAAREIAREFFAHDVVLGRLLGGLGMGVPGARAGGRFAPEPGLPPALLILRTSRRPTTLPPLTEAAVLDAPLPTPPAQMGSGARWSIAIVTHEELAFTRMALESVLANTAAGGTEVLVVDNASTDGTAEYLRAMAELHPCVRPILNPDNRGFAAASNQGLAAAAGEILVLLNNDTIVPPGWIEILEAHLANPLVGLVGPVTNEAGNEARIDTGYATYGEMVGFARARAAEMRGRATDIPVLTMFCTAMRRDVYDEVGPLDEDYGKGLFEDDDYAMRVRATGRRVICAQDAFVHHFGQASFGKLVPTGEYGELLAANRRRFEEKWRTTWNGHGARPSPKYERLREDVRRLVDRTVPADGSVVVITRGDGELLRLGARRASHFPRENDGTYSGYYPEHSVAAIRHLEHLRARGAEFLVVPATSAWWLDHYDGLAAHLRERHEEIARDDAGLVFALSPSSATAVCCVAGMHRSGTSMMMQALAAGGLWVGEPRDFFEASDDNPEGYWEHRRFVALNERILDRLGGAWDCPPAARKEWWREPTILELHEDAATLLAEFPLAPRWGWKDPRNSLTLPFWLDVVPELRVVACLRHPLAVASSLHRRAMHSQRFCLRLWQTYNDSLLAAAPPDRLIVADYDDLLDDPVHELRRVLAFLSLDIDEDKVAAAVAAVKPAHRHASAGLGEVALLDDVANLHARMRGLARADRSPACAP